METTIRLFLIVLLLAIFNINCRTSQETIIVCGNKYDIYKHTEYDYEQKLFTTCNTLCFHKSRFIAFSYQTSAFRQDTNLVYTTLKHSEDSLIVSTYYNKSVFGYVHEGHRYFRCLEKGFLTLPDSFIITKKAVKARKNKLKW